MLLLSGGLLIALIVAIYFIGKLYGSLDNAVINKQYIDLENKMEKAARQYVINNGIKVVDMQTINYETLVNAGFIDDLLDTNGNKCTGYVLINVVDNISHYSSYIKCPNYQTTNYNY